MSELKPFEYKYDSEYRLRKKAVVFYVTQTGNTEKIAQALAAQFDELGWDCTLAQVHKDTRITQKPRDYYLDDYDLVILGSPVLNGLPSPWFAQNFGLIGSEPPGFYHINDYGIFSATEKEKPYGLAYVTYSGVDHGPSDALAGLEAVKMYLDVMGCLTYGSFACPGKGSPRGDIDAETLWAPHDLDSRPNDDDLMKAKLWLKDVVLDCFKMDGRKSFGGEYISIS